MTSRGMWRRVAATQAEAKCSSSQAVRACLRGMVLYAPLAQCFSSLFRQAMLTDGLIWLSKATATQVYYLTIWLLNSVLIPAAPYLVALAVVASVRLVSILPSRRRPHHHQLRNGIHTRKNIAAVLGSGGHTSELLTLLSHLDENNDDEKAPRRPHTYFVSSGDELSEQKARRFEVARSSSTHPRVITLPRARRVHQSLLTAPFTVIQSFAACWYYINLDESTQLDLIIMNGPATCVPLVAAVYYRRVSRQYHRRISLSC